MEIRISKFEEKAMRCSLIVLLSVLIGGSQGCMTFQNGLCSPNESEAIFDPILLGEWTPINLREGEEGYFKVEKYDSASKAYRVSAVSLKGGKQIGEPYVYKAYLTKFKNLFFLDVVVSSEASGRKEDQRHHILKIDFKAPEMTVRLLSEEFIKGHPAAIRHKVETSSLGIESVRVMATTQELSDFVRQYAQNEAAWKRVGVLKHR